MALGDNNNKKQNYENTFYSRTRFTNYDEKKTLSFSFWKGLLKIAINEVKEAYSGVEYNELASIHLSPNKAFILKNQLLELKSLKDSATTSNAFGVDAGAGEVKSFIAFGNLPESTKEDIQRYLVIGKVQPDGTVVERSSFNFNHNYYFGIEWNNLEKMDCTTTYQNDVELDMLIIVLDEYIKAITGATAYSVMDMARFDYSRINTKIELVMNKLGIESKSSRQVSSESYFNKNGLGADSPENTNRARSQRTSIEDIA